jgi:hypothetical protein
MPKFRKKPVVIEAIQTTGGNGREVSEWANDPTVTFEKRGHRSVHEIVIVKTLEGTMEANVGDWIIKGVNGEFYPCKPDIFAKTYEPVE